MTTRNYFHYGKYAVLGIAGIFVFTVAVMYLWNWLVPSLFNGPVVTYWQTLGLLVLAKILFSGFGGSRHGHCRYPRSGHWHSREEWRKRYESRMNHMHDHHGEHPHGAHSHDEDHPQDEKGEGEA